MIFAMVLLGGITRLTGSGLSMVEWHPLMGLLPPMGEAEWLRVFDLYKESPQYELINLGMTLDDFKQIFFWEYLHRLFGRMIGVAFFVPWVGFLLTRRLRGALARRTAYAFLLGGLQGLLGWFMVTSGLVDRPSVSHLRLASHLLLAFVVAHYILWTIFTIQVKRSPEPGPRGLRRGVWALNGLLCLQIVYGAFMAGTHAGLVSPTFPRMNGEWFPAALLESESIQSALFADVVGIHFIHRVLAWLLVFAVTAIVVVTLRRVRDRGCRRAAYLLLGAVFLQFALGVLTILNHVPLPLAVAHQAGGFLLLSASVHLTYRLGSDRTPAWPRRGEIRDS
jgi:cytochrome c oxidase assembly protein subunit 15